MELHARNEISQVFLTSNHASTECSALKSLTLGDTTAQSKQERPYFRFRGVDYFPRVNANEVPALLNQGYHFLILDVGCLGEADFSEFLRCDRKIILGDLAPWKTWKYEEFFRLFDNAINLGEGFDYLVQTGTLAKNLSHFSKSHRISLSEVPFIKNPFCIEKQLFPFLEERLAK